MQCVAGLDPEAVGPVLHSVHHLDVESLVLARFG